MHNAFPELSLVIAIGAGLALLLHAFKQPLIIAHIITGIVVGPAALNVLHDEGSFATFSSLGIALLLFIIGLDLSVKALTRLRSTIIFTTLLQTICITILGLMAGRLLGFGKMESVILGLSLALSSTIIIVKLLNDKREITRLYAHITLGVLLLQDVIATAGKIGLAARSEAGSITTISWLLGRGAAVTIMLYLASRFIIPRLTRTIASSKELLLLFALGWGLGIATLFEYVGFSIEIGALFAGVSLASFPYTREMASRLKPLRDFFIVIFFITLGQTLTVGKVRDNIGIALILSSMVLLLKPLVVMGGLGLLGYTKRTSFKAAVSLSQVSEFSLIFIISASHVGLASERSVTIVTLVALITFITSTYLIKYDNKLYALLEKHLRFFERKFTKLEQRETMHRYPIVMFGFRKGGREFLKTFQSMEKRFVIIDYDPEVIETLSQQHLHYIYGDATDPEFLEELELKQSKLVVSNISDFKVNLYLAEWLHRHNPQTVFVCSAESPQDASELYDTGAAYVMMPHFVGSEKLSAFIKKNGFQKSEFKKYREKHISHIQSQFMVLPKES